MGRGFILNGKFKKILNKALKNADYDRLNILNKLKKLEENEGGFVENSAMWARLYEIMLKSNEQVVKLASIVAKTEEPARDSLNNEEIAELYDSLDNNLGEDEEKVES